MKNNNGSKTLHPVKSPVKAATQNHVGESRRPPSCLLPDSGTFAGGSPHHPGSKMPGIPTLLDTNASCVHPARWLDWLLDVRRCRSLMAIGDAGLFQLPRSDRRTLVIIWLHTTDAPPGCTPAGGAIALRKENGAPFSRWTGKNTASPCGRW